METIFEFHESFTELDEDYENEILIYANGEIVTSQRSTWCYMPDTVIKQRFSDEQFASVIKEVLDEYKDRFAEYESAEWEEGFDLYRLKIYDKTYSCARSGDLFFSDSWKTFIRKIRNVILFFKEKTLINWKHCTPGEITKQSTVCFTELTMTRKEVLSELKLSDDYIIHTYEETDKIIYVFVSKLEDPSLDTDENSGSYAKWKPAVVWKKVDMVSNPEEHEELNECKNLSMLVK